MVLRSYRKSIAWLFAPFLLLAVLACGAPAAPEAPAPAVDPPPIGTTGDVPPEATPVAEASPATGPPDAVAPSGTLNVGQKELGAFGGHPALVMNPALFVSQTAPIGEGLLWLDINQEVRGWLLESWDISPDFTTWTFNFHQGVQFHKGYGEMTSEDVVWSYNEWAKNDPHVRVMDIRTFWQHPDGSVETPDDYTVVVDTGDPLSSDGMLQSWILTPGGSANWVTSKSQHDEVGAEAADQNIAATGPWEIVEHRTSEFWRMRAVEDHWRQTPYFEEMVMWEIPEESSRIAGLQTGQLDTSLIAFDSIPLIEDLPGFDLVSVPNAMGSSLRLYGNYLVEAEAGEPRPSYDANAPWISSTSDVNSPEWAEAAQVRRAMSIAIDREALVETIFSGFAQPIAMGFWGLAHRDQLEGRMWEFDPDLAMELLADAGYGDGFPINLTTAVRAAPGEVEACEAVGTMWSNIGIDVRFQRIPYTTLRPQLVGRTYQGATCHASSERFVVGAIPQITTEASFNHGATHPFLEEIMPRIEGAVDPQERVRLEAEMGQWLFDHAYTNIGLYVVDAVWPAGARIEPWTEHAKTRDLRNITGYEFIRHKQE